MFTAADGKRLGQPPARWKPAAVGLRADVGLEPLIFTLGGRSRAGPPPAHDGTFPFNKAFQRRRGGAHTASRVVYSVRPQRSGTLSPKYASLFSVWE